MVWTDYLFAPSEYDIHGRVFDSNGTAISDEFFISGGLRQNPSVASLANGNAFVAWQAYLLDNQLYGMVFSPQGTAINNEFVISQTGTGKNHPLQA